MEVQIKKLRAQEERNQVLGGWHTEISLKGLGWTERLGRRRRSFERATKYHDYEYQELGKCARLGQDQRGARS